MKVSRFDRGQKVVCIGTGLPMLFRALQLAEAGAAVTLVDNASEIGGSWRTRKLFGLEGVEVGCHLVENRPWTNGALGALTPGESPLVESAVRGLFYGRSLPGRASRFALYCGLLTKCILSGRRDEIFHALKNATWAALSLNVPILYPVKGIAPVIAALAHRLDAAGAVFILNQPIESAHIKQGIATLNLGARTIQTERLVVSSRAFAPIEGLEIGERDTTCTLVRSVVMRLKARSLQFEGYTEVLGDDLVKRARNLTPFYAELKGDELVVVQIRPAAPSAEIAALDGMKALGLMSPGSQPLATHVSEVLLTTMHDRALNRLQRRFSPVVETIRTVDFSDERAMLTTFSRRAS